MYCASQHVEPFGGVGLDAASWRGGKCVLDGEGPVDVG